MARYYVVKHEARAARVPDALVMHDDGRVTTYRTGLAERGFESLEVALSQYGISPSDLEPVEALNKFGGRPPST